MWGFGRGGFADRGVAGGALCLTLHAVGDALYLVEARDSPCR